jgi:predicted ATPase
MRVGINSGEVLFNIVGDSTHKEYDISGIAVNIASAMEQNARPGSVTITKNTLNLLKDLIETKPVEAIKINESNELIAAYEAIAVKSHTSLSKIKDRPTFAPFVGRDSELKILKDAILRSRDGKGSVIGVNAEAGQGKSRLFFELMHTKEASEHLVVLAGAYAHTTNISMLPIRNILYNLMNIQNQDDAVIKKIINDYTKDVDSPFIASAILSIFQLKIEDEKWLDLVPQIQRKHTLNAIVKLLSQEAAKKPIILILEDLHWIDSDSEEFLEYLIQFIDKSKLCLILTYRPTYDITNFKKLNYQEILLKPLGKSADILILDHVLGKDSSLTEIKSKISDNCAGNPFFLEEIIKTLIQDAVLLGKPGDYHLSPSISMEDLTLPESIYSVLQTEINKLPTEIKTILQTAAVVGQRFEYNLIEQMSELSPKNVRTAHNELVKQGYIYEAQIQPDLRYSFKHALIQDVAYHGLLKKTRKSLHHKILNILENSDHEKDKENAILGYHAYAAEDWEKAFYYYSLSTNDALGGSKIKLTIKLFEKTIKSFQAINNPPIETIRKIGYQYLSVTHMYINLVNLEKARECVAEANKCSAAAKDLVIHIRAEGFYSIINLLACDIKEAIRYAKKGQRLIMNFPTKGALPKFIASILHDLGYLLIHTLSGQLIKAKIDLRKAKDLATELANKKHLLQTGKANSFSPLMNAYIFTSEYDLMIKAFNNSEKYRTDMDYEVKGNSLNVIPYFALACLAMASTHIGYFHYIEDKKEFIESKLDVSKINLSSCYWLISLGYVYVAKGEFEKANKILLQVQQYQIELGSKIVAPMISILIAISYARLYGNTPDVHKKLEDAMQISKELNYIYNNALLLGYISEGLIIVGDYKKAKEYNEEVLKIMQERDFPAQIAWLIRTSAEIDLNLPNPNFVKIKKKLDQSLQECTRLKMDVQIAHCHFALATLHQKTQDRKAYLNELKLASEIYKKLDMNYWFEKCQLM